MTDNEIIKSMQCVIGNEMLCSECTYQKVLPFPSCRMMCAKKALDLINRQKAENERLKERISYLEESIDCSRKEYNSLLQKLQQAKSEAIKEFAKRLKEKLQWDVEFENKLVFESDIDNLVKEMTEVNENDRA